MRRALLYLLLSAAALLPSCAPRQIDPNPTPIPWTSGNHIRTLKDGATFYPEMLAALRHAQRSITLETFAYIDSPIATTFTDLLATKARSGVKVRLILDQLGSKHLSEPHLTALRNSGAEVHLYHPFTIFRPWRTNNRTHRKILIVDGKIAFTGGAGIAHDWARTSPPPWRDTMYRFTGPAVGQLQRSFAENWQEVSHTPLTGPAFFPQTQTQDGPYRAAIVSDSPWTNRKNPLGTHFYRAITDAKRTLLLQQAYFVPSVRYRRALLAAAARGVKITVIVPSSNIDSQITRWSSQLHWQSYLDAGIELYEYRPSMLHARLLIADGEHVITGSGNLDDRAFFINDEANLHVLSKAFAREQTLLFRRDQERATRITADKLPSLLPPLHKRLAGRIMTLQL